MLSLSDNNPADVVEAFNSTSQYLDDLLNIDNPYIAQTNGNMFLKGLVRYFPLNFS